MHALDPGETAYLPEEQSVHSSIDELPAWLVVPDGQSSQTSSVEVAAATLLYFPSTHDVQPEAPLGENFPASQLVQLEAAPSE